MTEVNSNSPTTQCPRPRRPVLSSSPAPELASLSLGRARARAGAGVDQPPQRQPHHADRSVVGARAGAGCKSRVQTFVRQNVDTSVFCVYGNCLDHGRVRRQAARAR